MMVITTCPSHDELTDFASGLLNDDRFETIAEHLESCRSCGKVLSECDPQTHENKPSPLIQATQDLTWMESDGIKLLTENLLKQSGPSDAESAPKSIGRIQIVRHIASGSYGRVFLGWDEDLDRQVAVKLPRAGANLDDETIARIRKEAKLAARLEHPGIVPIYDTGMTEDGEIYIVSAFIDGCNLQEWHQKNSPTIGQSLDLVARIADIVDFAHRQRLIHRDIKPGNILIDTAGNPFLVDFGLSSVYDDAHDRSLDGLAGTPAYLPPENLDYVHPPLDPRGDLYSLGVILYELLTNSRPYELHPTTWRETLRNVEPIRPSEKNESIPADLERICLRAISKDPQRRHLCAADFAEELRAFNARTKSKGLAWSLWWLNRETLTYLSPAMILLLGMIGLASSRIFLSGHDSESVMEFERNATEVTPTENSFTFTEVALTTDPPGASVAIVPLNQYGDATDDAAPILSHQKTPLTVNLLPGEYFVELESPGHGFHQVYREVVQPDTGESIPTIDWGVIDIPRTGDVLFEMVTIPGASFEYGKRSINAMQTNQRGEMREFATFEVVASEITYGDYRRVMGDYTPAMKRNWNGPIDESAPLGYINYREALEFAEKAGLRLLTETEWEYVATNGGTTRFPWGVRFPKIESWDELSDVDKTINPAHPPVAGMFSGSGEWTSTGYSPNDFSNQFRDAAPGSVHVSRGIPSEMRDGKSYLEYRRLIAVRRMHAHGAYWSGSLSDNFKRKNLGVRLGRDITPRFLDWPIKQR